MEVVAAITKYCQYQERCHSEVRNKLYELGCHTTEVEQNMALLIENGILNEERFARSYARGKFRIKQWGKEKIKYQLRLKKVSDYCIRKAMEEIDEHEYEKTIIYLIQRKLAELSGERSSFTLRNKIFKYMQGKGFEKDIVIDLLKAQIKNSKK